MVSADEVHAHPAAIAATIVNQTDNRGA